MSTKNSTTARVQVASSVWDAACVSGQPVPGTKEIERRTVGKGTSVIVEGTRPGLLKLADRISRLKGMRMDERDRANERVFAAAAAIESGDATTAAQARERVAAKVAKLLEHARSAEELGNAEEAATFAGKVDELLVKFELGMSDLEYAAVQEADPIGRTTVVMAQHDAARPVMDGKHWRPKLAADQRRAWQERLCLAVANAFFCKGLVMPGSTNIMLVGRASHREMAEYVMVTLARDVLESGDAAAWELIKSIRRGENPKGANRGFLAAFRNGYVSAVAKRLREQREAELEAARKGGSDGKALIRLDNAYQAVERWLELNLATSKVGGVRGQYSSNGAGRSAGAAAGRKAPIGANALGGGKGGAPRALGAGQ